MNQNWKSCLHVSTNSNSTTTFCFNFCFVDVVASASETEEQSAEEEEEMSREDAQETIAALVQESENAEFSWKSGCGELKIQKPHEKFWWIQKMLKIASSENR